MKTAEEIVKIVNAIYPIQHQEERLKQWKEEIIDRCIAVVVIHTGLIGGNLLEALEDLKEE